MAWCQYHPSSDKLLLAGFRSYVSSNYSAELDRSPSLIAAQTNGLTTGGLTDTFSNYHDYTVSSWLIPAAKNNLSEFTSYSDRLATRYLDLVDRRKYSSHIEEVRYHQLERGCSLSNHSRSYSNQVQPPSCFFHSGETHVYVPPLVYGLLVSKDPLRVPFSGLEA